MVQETDGPSKEYLEAREIAEALARRILYQVNLVKDMSARGIETLTVTEAEFLRNSISELIRLGYFNK